MKKPEIIEGGGQFRAGRGAVVTDWCSTRKEALEQFAKRYEAYELYEQTGDERLRTVM